MDGGCISLKASMGKPLSEEGGDEKRYGMLGRERELDPSGAWCRGAGLGRASRRHCPGAAEIGSSPVIILLPLCH